MNMFSARSLLGRAAILCLVLFASPALADWRTSFDTFDASEYLTSGTNSTCARWDSAARNFVLVPNITWSWATIIQKETHDIERFTAKYRFRLSNGADGIIFIWSDDITAGSSNGGNLMWYNGRGYAVEIDNYKNSELGDPNGTHIAILKDGVNHHLAWCNAPTIENDAWHEIRVVNSFGDIQVYYDGTQVLSYAAPSYALTRGQFRFSGATGSSHSMEIIDDIDITATPAALPTFSITATVTGMASMAPIAGANVDLLKNGVAVDNAHTDSNGRCTLTGVLYAPPATWYIRASTSPSRTTEVPVSIVVAGGQYNYSVSIADRVPASGTVVDAFNQQGIAGAQITVFDNNNRFIATAITDASGHFPCDLQNPGTYYFVASKSGPIGSAGSALLYKAKPSQPLSVPMGSYVADLGVVALETNVVVLVHGINSNAANWEKDGYPTALRSDGWAVLDGIDLPGQIGSLHGFARIKKQAEYLKTQIDPIGVQSVNIVAHSQGGLVSRYLNENLAGPGGMVNKLIALATPQHGSPLATSAVCVREWLGETLFGANPAWSAYNLARFLGLAESAIPALDDLSPDSGFLKELNQRKNGWRTSDWTGYCVFDNPSPEKGLVGRTSYVTFRSEGWGNWSHYTGYSGPLMGSLFGCAESDGVVPTESAMLHAGSNNVFNYDAGLLVHHKANVVGIVESTVVRSQVQALLLADPSTWPTAARESAGADLLSTNDWAMVGLREMIVPANGANADSIAIDDCDSLRIAWSWYDGEASLELRTPSGAVVDSAYAATDPNIDLAVDSAARHGTYTIILPEPGQWGLHSESSRASNTQNVVVVSSSSGAIALTGTVSATAGGAYSDRILKIEIATPNSLPVLGATVGATWTGPTGTTGQLALTDDGVVPDSEAADGVYSGQFPVEQRAGMTQVTVQASGSSPYPFNRNTAVSFVAAQVLDIGIAGATMQAASGNYLALSPVTLSTAVDNRSAFDAEVQVQFRDGSGTLLASVPGIVPALGSTDFSIMHLPLAAGTYSYGVTVVLLGNYADADLVDNAATTSVEISAAVSGVHDDTGDGAVDGAAAFAALGNRSVAILAAYPNPFNPSITLEFIQRTAGPVEVRIFDVRGRLVRGLYSGLQPSGSFQFVWDGLDDAGARAASGTYFAHMRSPVGEDTRKVLLVK